MVTGWITADGAAAGASFELGPPDRREIVARSWVPRHLWARPVPDPDRTPQDALNEAIALVRQVAGQQSSAQRSDVEGAIRFCGVCCQYAGGIAPAPAEALPRDRHVWEVWLADFIDAVEAERLRLFPHTDANDTSEQRGSGILDGIRVFVSYAMPTNVQFARPLKRALQSQGAVVWFDQAERPRQDALAEGLRATIASQDVFLLCASRELFENAGYALQELAWVLTLHRDRSWTGAVCVAELDDVAVPRAFESVPRVALSQLDVQRWPEAIVALVLRARQAPTPVSTEIRAAADQRRPVLRELTLDELRMRATHVSEWWRLDETATFHALQRDSRHATGSPEYQALRDAIRRLTWNGSLATYDSWPADPAVRDARVRLGSLRTLFEICSIDVESEDSTRDLEADVAFLAERSLPLIVEPPVTGWDDEERRLAVRHHLGVLGAVENVVPRDLAKLVTERRLDCVDSLLELRASQRVAWDKQRLVHWDGAYHALDAFVYRGADQWAPAPPDWVSLAVAGARSDVSAVFAEVAWRASRSGAPAERVFDAKTIHGEIAFHVVAAPGEQPSVSIARESARTIGLAASIDHGGASLALEWHERAMRVGAARGTKILKL